MQEADIVTTAQKAIRDTSQGIRNEEVVENGTVISQAIVLAVGVIKFITAVESAHEALKDKNKVESLLSDVIHSEVGEDTSEIDFDAENFFITLMRDTLKNSNGGEEGKFQVYATALTELRERFLREHAQN